MATSHDEVMQEALRTTRPSRLPWVLLALAVAAGGAASVLLLQRLESLRTEAEFERLELRRHERALADALGGARDEVAELKANLSVLEKENAKFSVVNDDLASSLEEKENELAKLKATAEDMQQQLKAEIANGEIRLTQANGRLKVDLVDKILFDSGATSISGRGQEVLGRVGAVLARSDRQVQVAGHTDDAPISPRLAARYPTNWELSTSRATNVVRFLAEKARVPPRRLVASGYGPFHPVASNATPAGRGKNRRIEILLTPALASSSTPAVVRSGATRDGLTQRRRTARE